MIELEQARELVYNASDLQLLLFLHDKQQIVKEYIVGHKPHLKEVATVCNLRSCLPMVNILMSFDYTKNFFSKNDNNEVQQLCSDLVDVLKHKQNRQSEDLRFIYLVALWLSCDDENVLCNGINSLLRDTDPLFEYQELYDGFIFYLPSTSKEIMYGQDLGVLALHKRTSIRTGRGGRVYGLRDLWSIVRLGEIKDQPLEYNTHCFDVNSSIIVSMAQQILIHAPDAFISRHGLCRYSTTLQNRPVV